VAAPAVTMPFLRNDLRLEAAPRTLPFAFIILSPVFRFEILFPILNAPFHCLEIRRETRVPCILEGFTDAVTAQNKLADRR
jgi:hypothetical protein